MAYCARVRRGWGKTTREGWRGVHRDPSHQVSSGNSDTSGTVFTSENPPPSVLFFGYQHIFDIKVSATATATGGALVGSGHKDCSRKVLEDGARIQRVDGRWHAQKYALELKQAGCLPRLNEPRWEIFRAKVA